MKKLICIFVIFHTVNPISLLLLDTQGKDRYSYRNVELLAQEAGFTTHYKNIYDFLEDPKIDQYDAIFFMVNPLMLNMSPLQQGLNKLSLHVPILFDQTYITALLKNALESFASLPNKGVGIILPGRIVYSGSLKSYTKHFVEHLLFLKNEPSHVKQLVYEFLEYILTPDTYKGSLFGTSLINPGNPTFPSISKSYAINILTNTLTAITTPIDFQTDELTNKALPIGLLYKHKNGNIFFMSKLSEFDFADISEHFFKNPLSLSARNELLKAAQASLQSWYDALQTHEIPTDSPEKKPLSDKFSLKTLAQKKKAHANKKLSPLYNWMTNKSISCAWLDPYDFFAHEDALRKIEKSITIVPAQDRPPQDVQTMIQQIALSRGAQITYDANFNILWFEFMPEWYLSPHGLRKEQRNEYIQRIERLAQEIKSVFSNNGILLPQIFVGLNLSSNFKSYPVKNPVFDFYGHMYSKIPCPFDLVNFWKPEVFDPFWVFHSIIGRYLRIDGVFFDFEMYHAQDQTGTYTDIMDFSDMSWMVYCLYAKNKEAATHKTIKSRIVYLQKEKKFKEYFTILQQAACDLGRAIKKHFRQKMPHLLFAAYAPTLPNSWFYRGIYAGLSSPQEPLLLATFNTDYVSHCDWLESNNIYLLHGSAVMISKLNHPKDFQIIKTLLCHHDFVWYNRPSRMVYEYDKNELGKVWWGIESSSANRRFVMHGIKHQHLILPICN